MYVIYHTNKIYVGKFYAIYSLNLTTRASHSIYTTIESWRKATLCFRCWHPMSKDSAQAKNHLAFK